MIQNSKFKIQNCRRGFTLIEVLAVMAIIAILATIVFVSIGNQRQRARLTGATMSVKSAMTIAATCATVGGAEAVQAPATGTFNPDNPICIGVAQISDTAVWPDLPNKCRYCGGFMNLTQVNYRCDGAACAGDPTKDSFCDYDSTQCVQNN